MIQLALYFNIIGSYGVAMTMQNYIQSASLKRFLIRWKQNTRTTSNHAGMLESLCPAKHSLPSIQSAFKRDFHHTYLLYLYCAHKMQKILLLYLHTLELVFELVRLHFQHVHTATTILIM